MKKIDLKEVTLRQETPADYRETETLVRNAFWNQFQPGAIEHYLIHVMRDADRFISKLDIIAKYQGKTVGQIAYMENYIQGDDGIKYPVIGIGPICVATEYEGNGIGEKLINYTRDLAIQMGYSAILLQGDPDFYSRKGFVPSKQYSIRTVDNKYAAAQQIVVLSKTALKGVTGRYIEDSIYFFEMDAVDKFDKTFPHKEKISGVRLQNKINQIVGMVEDYNG
ncbi:GNAT family N-acetyltransferase [Companilactobacillus kedongensis]|uniref:GNAT family N-acetyltransferase n=1 Tax=Companilactobacillus kedongensis TaxID=2486004 RepID=UPI001CDD282A|nr:N-acetyltransferase [Companilactobacillus kedongensis]